MRKLLAIIITVSLLFQQTGFAQIAPSLDVSGGIAGIGGYFIPDKFRPVHLRYLSFDSRANNFDLLLDRGDVKKIETPAIKETTAELMEYFMIGLSLPNDAFWVNLRPDSPRRIIDADLEKTELGRILLEADLQLKKDTARHTSPNTPEGREYWNRLYARADALFGADEELDIPAMTRPWIVPGEIIISETDTGAYILKATMKVMLEEDYLKQEAGERFSDGRVKELNAYSAQLMRELILPKLTREINSAKRYSSLRQVFYSLILAQWFKTKAQGQNSALCARIDSKDLSGFTAKTAWSKHTYFQAYRKSFFEGEYNQQEHVRVADGVDIRTYVSGGAAFAAIPDIMTLTRSSVRGQLQRFAANIQVRAVADGGGFWDILIDERGSAQKPSISSGSPEESSTRGNRKNILQIMGAAHNELKAAAKTGNNDKVAAVTNKINLLRFKENLFGKEAAAGPDTEKKLALANADTNKHIYRLGDILINKEADVIRYRNDMTVLEGRQVLEALFAGAASRLFKNLRVLLEPAMRLDPADYRMYSLDLWAVVDLILSEERLIEDNLCSKKEKLEKEKAALERDQVKSSDAVAKINDINGQLKTIFELEEVVKFIHEAQMSGHIPSAEERQYLQMGPRQLLVLKKKIVDLAEKYKNDGWTAEKALKNQKIIMHINDDIEPWVIEDLIEHDFYGFDSENIYLVKQPMFHGFDLETLKYVFATKALPYGHLYATRQMALDGQAYTARDYHKDELGNFSFKKNPVEEGVLDKLSGQFDMIETGRINDLTRFGGDIQRSSDVAAVAQELIDRGYDVVVTNVKNPFGIKGGTAFEKNGLPLVAETMYMVGSEYLMSLVEEAGKKHAAYNAFRLFYGPKIKEYLEQADKLFYLRVEEEAGKFLLYTEGATTDIVQLPGIKVAMLNLEEDSQDFKELSHMVMVADHLPQSDELLADLPEARREFSSIGKKKDGGLSAEELRSRGSWDRAQEWLKNNDYIFGGGFGYDIRINDALSEQDEASRFFYVMGRKLGADYLEKGRALVTADQRLTSEALRQALVQGLIDAGIDVTTQPDNSVTTSGLTSRKALAEDFDLAVQITGSHNPKEGNGAKIVLKSLPFYGQDLVGLKDAILESKWSQAEGKGRLTAQGDLVGEHIEMLDRILPKLQNPASLIVDFRRGAAADVFIGLAERRGYTVVRMDSAQDALDPVVFETGKPALITLNDRPSGNMEAGIWDPSKPESFDNIKQLQKRIHASDKFSGKSFAGAVFDGDGDRAGALDETGTLILPERMLMNYYQRMVLENISGVKALNRIGHTVKLALDVRASSIIIDVLRRISSQEGLDLKGEFIAAGFPNHRDFVRKELQSIEKAVRNNDKALTQEEKTAIRQLMLAYTSAEASGHFFFNVLAPEQFLDKKILVDDGITSMFVYLHLVETLGEYEAPGTETTLKNADNIFGRLPVTNEVRFEAPADVNEKQKFAEDIAIRFAQENPGLLPVSMEEFLQKIAVARSNPPEHQDDQQQLLLVDGIRVRLNNGVWFLVRKSNTSAAITFKAEADAPGKEGELIGVLEKIESAIIAAKKASGNDDLDMSAFTKEIQRLKDDLEPATVTVAEEDAPESAFSADALQKAKILADLGLLGSPAKKELRKIAAQFQKVSYDNGQPRGGWIDLPSWEQVSGILGRIGKMPVLQNEEKDGFKDRVLASAMGGSINTIKTINGIEQAHKIEGAGKTIYTIDDLDPGALKNILASIPAGELKNTLILGISKSTTTVEPNLIMQALKEKFSSAGLDFRNHFVWMIDLPNAHNLKDDWPGVTMIPIQANEGTDVGGRFTAPSTLIFLLPMFLKFNGDMERLGKVYREFLRIMPAGAAQVAPLVKQAVKNDAQRFVIVPDKDIPQEALETWEVQLNQESFGSKKQGFDPKTIVRGRENLPDKKFGFTEISFDLPESSIEGSFEQAMVKTMMTMYYLQLYVALLALETKMNFSDQAAVEGYKEQTRALEGRPAPRQEAVDLDAVNVRIRQDIRYKPEVEFIEVVAFWALTETERKNLEADMQAAFPDKMVLVFKGSDWNHHSYQAAVQNQDTQFVLLTKKKYDTDIPGISAQTLEQMVETLRKIAYATHATLKGKSTFFELIPQEIVTLGVDDADFRYQLRQAGMPESTEGVILQRHEGNIELPGDTSYEEAIDKAVKEEKPVDNQRDGGVGGIDFRSLPANGISGGQRLRFEDIGFARMPVAKSQDLDVQWKAISSQLANGNFCSEKQLKEYLAGCCQSGRAAEHKERMLLCISALLRGEEEEVSATSAEVKELLLALSS